MKKYVYHFNEGTKDMKDLLGGKGANLAEMTSLKINVPPGFTITTEVCDLYYKNNKTYPKGVKEQVEEHLRRLEEETNAKFGDKENPLLLSVRSGAAASMPGMMDTVLNLGLNDDTIHALIKKTGNERFAYDSYRRFIHMFGDVVMGVAHEKFEEILQRVKETKGIEFDTELTTEDLKEVVEKYKGLVRKETGRDFPSDPREQLQMAIDAVFGSWNIPRAVAYRRLNKITGLLGTAVNVQAMVFGNMGANSATGVLFTRNPSTGENKLYGEFLVNAQGEDVVAGIRTPKPIKELEKVMPECYKEIVDTVKRIEKHYRDMQDIEFTIQEGRLFFLQTRTGKRTAQAAVKIAVDMVEEGLITEDEAVLRVNPNQLDQLLHKQLDEVAKKKATFIAKGLPASPGAAIGTAVFSAEDAFRKAEEGEKVILVRVETSPEDIEGMNAAQGILTARGGMTSHAAVVARGMGKCCVAGCGDISIDEKAKQFRAGDIIVKEGDWITLDGSMGDVYLGKIPLVEPKLSGDFAKLMKWADKARKLKVRTNADTPHDSKLAREFGAEGIGLCRTEHMFFEGDRIKAVREMILAHDLDGRKKALAKIEPMQREDFIGIFKEMKGLPVTIRLLDPPLHEFLPHNEKEINEIANELGVTPDMLKKKIEYLHEMNPMLGHRGCRLAITYPEIAEMQTQAIIEAACTCVKEGINVIPEIMVPLVGHVNEFNHLKEIIVKKADGIIKENGVKLDYKVGTMIEVPRGALTADEIAKEAEFFSFGTNDLTQMAFGFSRDDVGKFVPFYIEKKVLESDPFAQLDQSGVGQLLEIAVRKGKSARKDLKLGICGEHGGDPSSIEFCHKIGLDYVSCSPYRVPIARLAAAHAALKEKRK
jgi:pyruvate,orthophosphate dikinase